MKDKKTKKDKINNILGFDDFEKNWKPEEAKKTKRTETGIDIVKEHHRDSTAGQIDYIIDNLYKLEPETVKAIYDIMEQELITQH